MATLSSHLLNSVNGTHASNVNVIIYQIKSNSEKKVLYETKTDSGGRLLKEFILDEEDCKSEYESFSLKLLFKIKVIYSLNL